MSARESDIIYEVSNGVAVISFNRPERYNSVTLATQSLLFDAFERADHDRNVRVIVLTGRGRSFCPGGDLNHDGDPPPVDPRAPTVPLEVSKPTIAAINGACAGIGLLYALMCDIRFASPGCRMTTAFVRRGTVAEQGIGWLLPRVVGASVASDLLLSGRTFTSDEAYQFGLVNRLITDDGLLDVTMEYAYDVAQNCSPAAMAAIKRQLLDQWNQGLYDHMVSAQRLTTQALMKVDHDEGVLSFVEKRPPSFAPLGEGTIFEY